MKTRLASWLPTAAVVWGCAGAILAAPDRSGRRDETLVLYTSDNGMPYPRAKASAYPAGILMPMAVAGPGSAAGGICDRAVSLIDLMPIILDALGFPRFAIPVSRRYARCL